MTIRVQSISDSTPMISPAAGRWPKWETLSLKA